MDFSKLTDDELEKMIEEKYGEDWNLVDVDETDDLIIEFSRRIEIGA